MADDGELVESGTFRVDRKKALEKLKEFQLPDPTMFLLPWVRCAVASGATFITIDRDAYGTRLTMAFDGRLFTVEELRDPYGCLLDESTPENVRNRQLAVGILAALRLGPTNLRVTSGKDSERGCLLIESTVRETLVAPQVPSSGTVLEVMLSGGHADWEATVDHVVRCYQRWGTLCLRIVSPFGVDHVLGGERNQYHRVSEITTWPFSVGEVQGWVEVPENPTEAQSTMRLYHYGVLVESFVDDTSPIPVTAVVNNDRFQLNVSQSGVVRNEEFERTRRIVADQAGRLLTQVCQAQDKSLAAYDALRFRYVSKIPPWLIQLGPFGGSLSLSVLALVASKWIAKSSYAGSDLEYLADGISFFSFFFAMTLGLLFLGLPVTTISERETLKQKPPIREAAQVTGWLRKACAALLQDYHSDSADPVRKTLWEVPIFLSAVDGPPFSLVELRIQRQQLGYVPYSMEPGPRKSSPHKVVWCTDEQDRIDLTRLLEGPLVDETDTLQTEHGDG